MLVAESFYVCTNTIELFYSKSGNNDYVSCGINSYKNIKLESNSLVGYF